MKSAHRIRDSNLQTFNSTGISGTDEIELKILDDMISITIYALQSGEKNEIYLFQAIRQEQDH